MKDDEYTITLIEDFTDSDAHRLTIDIGNSNFNNIITQFLSALDNGTLEGTLEVDSHWRDKTTDYLDYQYEPFNSDDYYLRKFIFSSNLPTLKYIQFELEKLLNSLIELEKNLKADSYTDKKHTEVTTK